VDVALETVALAVAHRARAREMDLNPARAACLAGTLRSPAPVDAALARAAPTDVNSGRPDHSDGIHSSDRGRSSGPLSVPVNEAPEKLEQVGGRLARVALGRAGFGQVGHHWGVTPENPAQPGALLVVAEPGNVGSPTASPWDAAAAYLWPVRGDSGTAGPADSNSAPPLAWH